MSQIRLQKYLAAAGVASRRRSETLIASGRIKVNGAIVTQPGTRVDPDRDRIEFDDNPVILQQDLVYIALNKPRGYVSSCRQQNEKPVIDLIDTSMRIFPVGRLDKDSTGLLLLTNDGRIHHRLSHPSFDHEKEYDVTVSKPIPASALKKMEKGLTILGTRTRPAQVDRVTPRQFRIVLKEGRNRQIRRMVQKVGNQVTRLHRIRVASIYLGNLPARKWRYLTKSEKTTLLKITGLDDPNPQETSP
jgi:pseudouridine synthase